MVNGISYGNLTKSAARGIRGIMGGLVLLGGFVFLAGCPGKETSNPTTPTTPTTTPTEPKISVGEPPFSVTLNESGPETLVTLPYKSQGGAVPTSCEVSSPSMVTVTKTCACSAGVCRVGVQPTPKVFGVGSFEFSLSGQNGISSNKVKATVKVLEVTLSISSGDKQDGIVGTTLEKPIVVLVQNSNKAPVPGVEVFWNVNRLEDYKNWEEGWIGKVSSCTEKTDDRGLAQCTWTLGTRIPVGTSQTVNVSAFYKDAYKKTLGISFGASVKPDSAAILSFWTQGYDGGKSSGWQYYGPRTPKWSSKPLNGKAEKAGAALGRPLGEGKALVVFLQDQYGNSIEVGTADISLTLTLGETKPNGAVLSGTPTVKAIDRPVESDSQKVRWTQGMAIFEDVRVNKVGIYTLSVTASDPNLKVSSVSGMHDFGAEFTVDPGDATRLAFTTQPSRVAKATVWPKPPVVTVLDDFDNTVISSKAQISLVISAGSGTSGALLGGTTVIDALDGVATFSGLSIDKAGKGYTLTASSKGFPSITSERFSIDE